MPMMVDETVYSTEGVRVEISTGKNTLDECCYYAKSHERRGWGHNDHVGRDNRSSSYGKYVFSLAQLSQLVRLPDTAQKKNIKRKTLRTLNSEDFKETSSNKNSITSSRDVAGGE